MAPAEPMSPPGSSTYSSDTMTVGDGTWVFSKNTFLLPNLVGLNFETMQYNGMGNRFATVPQYHRLVLAHGILAVMTFLFIIPASAMMARFYTRRIGYAIKYHAYLGILALGLTTVVFILGYFAVGPNRSLTNPHHGIGVALYTLIILQVVGGRLVRNVRKRLSLRIMLHQWSGRTTALLGLIQIPLGLTLYGSPKYLFILYAVWTAFLVLLYFVLSYHKTKKEDLRFSGGRSEVTRSELPLSLPPTERKSSAGFMRYIVPAGAAAGAFSLFKGRRDRARSRSRSRSRSHSRSRARTRSRSRLPEVLPSHGGSESFIDEKYTERRQSGGGFMGKLAGLAGAVGGGALAARLMRTRNDSRYDDEYTAVATDTPSRIRKPRRHTTTVSDLSEESEDIRHGSRRSPLLPGPSTAPLSGTEVTPRPVTPRPSHHRVHSKHESIDDSDYTSYISPSRRRADSDSRVGGGGGTGGGFLAAIGLGWAAKKLADRKNKKEEDRRLREEDERWAGHQGSRFTGDGHPSPSRRPTRRGTGYAPTTTATTLTQTTDASSSVEPRPAGSGYGPPMPPLPHGPLPIGGSAGRPLGGMPAGGMAAGGRRSRSRSASRHSARERVSMPAMPPDPQGVLHQESASDTYNSSGGPPPQRRHSSRRRRQSDAAAAAAVESASRLAAKEERRRRGRDQSQDSRVPRDPVSVKVRVHDDPDRNVTLRRLTEEEAAVARDQRRRRRRSNSISSVSEVDSPAGRRYRRDTSQRRAEAAAERAAESIATQSQLEPLSPPNPAFAAGRKPAKDSAYYSGQPGPSGYPHPAGTVTSIESPGSHGTWSAMSPSASGLPDPSVSISADERRRKRRLERRAGGPPPTTTDFD